MRHGGRCLSDATSTMSRAVRRSPSPHQRNGRCIRRLPRSSALRNSTLLLVLAGVWLFFYFATNGTFLTQRNLVLLALQTSIVSLAAISAVMLIVTRNFDLSVGSAVALVGVVVALLTVKHDVEPAGRRAGRDRARGVADGRLAGLVGDDASASRPSS